MENLPVSVEFADVVETEALGAVADRETMAVVLFTARGKTVMSD